jgi:pilus assembly protein CpaE
MSIKVSAICTTPDDLAALSRSDVGAGAAFSAHLGSVQLLGDVLKSDQPDVLIIDVPDPNEQAMQLIESALSKANSTHLVLVSPDRSVELLMRAMRAGVREVLPAPLTLATVQQVIHHAQGYPLINGRHRNAAGQVYALIQAKGGSGATFLATNLAHALSKQGKRVVVLDLNLYFGDAAMFLGNSNAVSSVVELARQTHRMDATLLESSMIKFSDNLHVLPAPESPEHIHEVTPAAMEKIIDLARSHYDFVILDVPSMLSPVTIKALDLADSIYLTLQLNLPFIRAAKLMVAVFRTLGYSNGKINLIVNRYEKSGDVGLSDVENATGLKVHRTIPNSHKAVNSSINQGVPMIDLMPGDPVAHALASWANLLAPITTAPQPARSWFQGLLRLAS